MTRSILIALAIAIAAPAAAEDWNDTTGAEIYEGGYSENSSISAESRFRRFGIEEFSLAKGETNTPGARDNVNQKNYMR